MLKSLRFMAEIGGSLSLRLRRWGWFSSFRWRQLCTQEVTMMMIQITAGMEKKMMISIVAIEVLLSSEEDELVWEQRLSKF